MRHERLELGRHRCACNAALLQQAGNRLRLALDDFAKICNEPSLRQRLLLYQGWRRRLRRKERHLSRGRRHQAIGNCERGQDCLRLPLGCRCSRHSGHYHRSDGRVFVGQLPSAARAFGWSWADVHRRCRSSAVYGGSFKRGPIFHRVGESSVAAAVVSLIILRFRFLLVLRERGHDFAPVDVGRPRFHLLPLPCAPMWAASHPSEEAEGPPSFWT